MPTAESEETMHLFIDFLAEGRICQTVCNVCVCVCQRCERRSVRMCACARAPICDRDTLEARKRNVIQPPRRETQKERVTERKSETTGISRGIVFLVTHPVFVPGLQQCV